MSAQARNPVAGVGVVCLRGNEVLLVRRGKPPLEGEWSLPGGRIEFGETAIDAARRELLEETGVHARIGPLLDVVDAIFGDANDQHASHHVLIDFAAAWLDGEPEAADDVTEARFFPADDAIAAVRWPQTKRIIRAALDLDAI